MSRGLLLSATGSGQGKTTVALALTGLLQGAGQLVQPLKCGPDYLDAMLMAYAAQRRVYHADPFFSDAAGLRSQAARLAGRASFLLYEGAMGYYDGIGGTSEGSAYTVAEAVGLPVILICSVAGMGCSIGAVIRGFMEYRPRSGIVGVLLNQVKPALFDYYRNIIERETGLCVIGYLPPMEISLKSQHLGLCTPQQQTNLSEMLEALTQTAAQTIDLHKVLGCSGEIVPEAPDPLPAPEKHYRLGIAQDEAFHFYYAENLDLLRRTGAELVLFSPLHDAGMPSALDGVYLGGGYPELYLPALSANRSFMDSFCRQYAQGLPVWAECGGFLYLHAYAAVQGRNYPLCGILPGTWTMTERLQHFGYGTLTLNQDSLMGRAGTVLKAHEFHYARAAEDGTDGFFTRPGGAQWPAYHLLPHLAAGFPHLWLPSAPEAAECFAQACLAYQRKGRRTE